MTTLRISAAVKQDVYDCEFHLRAEQPNEPKCMSVYSKIVEAVSTRKDRSVTIEVDEAELAELYKESEYSGDSMSAMQPNAGYIKAWAGLKRQIEKSRS